MTTMHTPGPYYISETTLSPESSWAPEGHYVHNGRESHFTIHRAWDNKVTPSNTDAVGDYQGALIARVPYVAARGAVPNREQALANARLIAAAPELLAACQELFDLFEVHMPPWYTRGHFNRLSAAIAKAQPPSAIPEDIEDVFEDEDEDEDEETGGYYHLRNLQTGETLCTKLMTDRDAKEDNDWRDKLTDSPPSRWVAADPKRAERAGYPTVGTPPAIVDASPDALEPVG